MTKTTRTRSQRPGFSRPDALTATSSCTPHCEGQCQPACTGQGHCVANIGTQAMNRRPSRQDMLDWASARACA